MKKISFLLLALILSISFSSVCFATEEEPYREKIPRIVFIENVDIPEVEAGSELSLVIKYKNDSTHTASDLRITPNFENVPIVYERPVTFERRVSLRGGKEDVTSFNFKVRDDAKVGVYAIKFKVEFENARDENYSREEVAYFRVTKEKVKPIIIVSNISTGDASVYAGGRFKLTFDVGNNGEVKADNVEVLISGQSQSTFMVVDSNDYKYIGTVEPGASVKQEFDINVSDSITKGNNTLNVNINYKDTFGNEHSTEKTIYILDVKSEKEAAEESDTAATPKIIISSYSTNPVNIVAGNDFGFTFNIKNTSKEKRLRNMKVTISSEDGAFIITKGSNTFYIEEMDKSAIVTKVIDLKAKQSLTSNSYPVNISFDFEDFNGNQYNSSETINIPVTEYSKLVINSVGAGEGYVGSNTNLSFDYVNMGKATVSNLTASVEGDYTSVQSINYIGNLEPGSSDYYDIEVTPTKNGQNYGVLVLSFEDSSGRINEVRKEFEGFAMEQSSLDNSGMDDPGKYKPGMIPEPTETVEKVGIGKIILYGIGTFLISFIIVKIIATKVIRKKLEDEI